MQLVALSLVLAASLRPGTAGPPARKALDLAAFAELNEQQFASAGSKKDLDAMMENMTLASAVAILRKRFQVFPKLNLVARSRFLGHQEEGNAAAEVARWAQGQPDGTDKAKEILTKMIVETEKKLDMEQNRCNDYNIAQMAVITTTKDDISSFNAAASLARAEILEAQGSINEAEKQLPILGGQLKKHEDECAEDIGIIQGQLNLAQADVNVMDGILKQTSCTSAQIAYPTFLQCVDLATGEEFLTFRERVLRVQVAKLRQTSVRQEVLESLLQDSNLRDPAEALARLEKDLDSSNYSNISLYHVVQEPTTAGPTTTTIPTTTTPMPSKKKAQSKCSLSNNENCFILRDRFMQIQGQLVEKVDALKTVLAHKQKKCDDASTAFETEISSFKSQLSSAQTALAASTTKQNEADAGSRLKNQQLQKLEKDHAKETKTCNQNIAAFQGDICAVKKIRTQVEMLKSGAIDPKFAVVDCAVGKWKTEPCSVTCGGGGVQTVRRAVLTPAKNGGAECPMTERTQACGNVACPVNCVQGEWSEWSACSAACGGGVRTRARATQVESQHGGEPCGEKELTETCGTGACDSDCELSPWSQWTVCSKKCNGGSSERKRSIEVPKKGEGKCAKKDDESRFLTRPCNEQACVPQGETLQCNNTKLDVVIVLDASGSLKEQGWEATKSFAKTLVKAFEPADVRIALQTFSGAKGFQDSKKCAMNPADFDIEKDCGITWLQHFTDDQGILLKAIEGAIWTKSFTLMSLALGAAEIELAQGRKDASSVVIVVTDGRPMSKEKTGVAAHNLRKKARLLFIPVTRFAPISDLKEWGSVPSRDNVISVPDWDTLELPATITTIIADVCPDVF